MLFPKIIIPLFSELQELGIKGLVVLRPRAGRLTGQAAPGVGSREGVRVLLFSGSADQQLRGAQETHSSCR